MEENDLKKKRELRQEEAKLWKEKNNTLRLEWGDKIRQLRREKHMTKRELAEITGTQIGHIGRIEEGKYAIRIETLVTILNALGYKLEIVPR